MLCPNCGNVLLEEKATFCDKCEIEVRRSEEIAPSAKTLPANECGSANAGTGALLSSAVPGTGKASSWNTLALASALIYLILVWLLLVRYWAHQNDDWASASGYVLGTSLVPAAIVLVYYKRRTKQASSARVITVLASWIMVANLFTIGRSRPHITKGDIPVIAREAAGLVPVSNPDDTGRTAVRDCFKQIINTNQTYMAKVNAITFEDLYTPKSYLNRDTGKRVLSQIETAMEVEGGQESGLDAILSYCEARINALDWPKGEKKNFIEGFEEKFRQTAEERVPTVTSEQQWLASLRDIYLYSLENSRYFRADGRQVRISNLQVLAEFNSRIEQANQLRDRYLAAKSEFELRQKTYFDQFGMSKADFGLKH